MNQQSNIIICNYPNKLVLIPEIIVTDVRVNETVKRFLIIIKEKIQEKRNHLKIVDEKMLRIKV